MDCRRVCVMNNNVDLNFLARRHERVLLELRSVRIEMRQLLTIVQMMIDVLLDQNRKEEGSAK
jgi:hypothetical protein